MPRRRAAARKGVELHTIPAPDVRNAACIVGFFGASGTGKSTQLKREAAALPGPLLVFDPGHEYRCLAFDDEARFLSVAGTVPGPIALRPCFDPDRRARQFDRFCRGALAVCRTKGGASIIVDELHLVTDSGRAPAGWRELIETGRKFGARVFAASIRPAAIDKGFWTNCTRIRTGRLNYRADCDSVANALNVRQEEVAQLSGLAWIERDMGTGELRRGTLAF